jgi:hypothetical protein
MAARHPQGRRRMGACETTPPTTHTRETAAPNTLPPAPIISRRSPASSSFVLAATRLRALIALPSWVRVFPGERFGRSSFEDLMETASLGMALEA